jgi:hypothetical protein
MELKSILNIAETEVKKCEKSVDESLQFLDDAEVLLARAIRMKTQENEFF